MIVFYLLGLSFCIIKCSNISPLSLQALLTPRLKKGGARGDTFSLLLSTFELVSYFYDYKLK